MYYVSNDLKYKYPCHQQNSALNYVILLEHVRNIYPYLNKLSNITKATEKEQNNYSVASLSN